MEDVVDEDELALLRQEQDDTVDDLAHAYPSIRELTEAPFEVEPFADTHGAHELACRLIADEIFEQHRDHLDAIASTHVLDLVGRVADKLAGSPAAEGASTSLLQITVPALRDEIVDPAAEEPEERERELRDAVALVLAAKSLQSTALDW